MTEIRVLVGALDFEVSNAFYGDTLGLAIEEEWDDDDGRGTLYRASSGGLIEIFEDSPHHPFVAPAGVKAAIEVGDVDVLYERAQRAGADIVDPIAEQPWGHRSFELRDPSGFHLVFFTLVTGEAESGPPNPAPAGASPGSGISPAEVIAPIDRGTVPRTSS